MRGNNKRKLMSEELLSSLLALYNKSVPLAKLISNYSLKISAPHLKKLLFIYNDILNEELDTRLRDNLRKAIFPEWVHTDITTQPDDWTYKGKFPYGTWERK